MMRSRCSTVLAAVLVAGTAGCTDDGDSSAQREPTASPSSTPPSQPPPAQTPTPSPARADEERDGVVKAPGPDRLKETDEFGLVVRAERRDGAIHVVVDRVYSLGGEEAERAAAERGTDVSNDHFEVNDNPKTRPYVLADDAEVWQVVTSDQVTLEPMTASEWLAYVNSRAGRGHHFHFDVEDGRVVGIEEQYFP